MDKTFDAAAREPAIYAAWEAAGAFRAGAGARPGAEPFCIMIPPPNVTGALHMGHAFNNTLQDILTRWHRMRGFDTLWQPGTDHAGIATQMVVERELAKTNRRRRDMPRDEFVGLVWQQKQRSRGNIRQQLERLGASCDWSREAFTMTGAPGDPDRTGPDFHDAVLKVFVDFYNRGLIYRGKRLVNWDPHFETAISDLEVEQVEQDGRMWHFKYPLAADPETGRPATYEYVERDADGNVTLRETRDWISIATTRPETMLGDGAVAVHPSDARYAPIVGQLCEIPVGPKEHRRLIPIVADPYPDPDFGSGAVKITGAHDFNDYAVAQRHDIPKYRLMDTSAHMRDDGAPYAEAAALALAVARGETTLSEAEADEVNLVPDDLRGLDRYEARARVVAQITAEGLAVMVPATDPRLGPAATKAPEPGPRPEGRTAAEDAPDQVRGAGEQDDLGTPLVPLVEHRRMVQPTGDRSGVVIEPMLTDQWFVDAGRIVRPAIDAVRDGRTTILPESDAKVYFHWLENIEPWCISRQLWWGHRIPVWYGLDLGTETFRDDEGDGALDEVELGRLLLDGGMLHEGDVRHCDTSFEAVVDRFRDGIADLPMPLNHARIVEVADREAAIDTFAASLADYNVEQDPTHLVFPVWRDPDVLDTWFSSGLWPLGTLGWPEQTPELARYYPTSVLVTGFDIIFFWVARMMMMQLALVDEVPFRNVYVHALVRDEKGKKMSKSLGNVIDPMDLIDEFGADAVRFTLTAMAAMGRDLKLSKDRIAGYRNFVTKLWNAHRFAEMNGVLTQRAIGMPQSCTGTQTARCTPPATATANRWIIGETARVREEVDAALAAFRFNDAAGALYSFVWGKVCDWYVEVSKPLFDGKKAEETRQVMAWVLDQCLILLHPIMPFVTEELWSLGGQRDSLLALAEWPSYGAELVDPEAESEMRWVIALIESVRSVRGEMNVPPGARVPLLLLELDEAGRNALNRNEDLILRLARIEAVTEAGAAPKGSATIAVEGGAFALPLAGVIDIAAEKARLSKALDKLAKEAAGLRGRLSNPRFVDSAPPEIVEETREQLAHKEEEEARLRTALARLADAG